MRSISELLENIEKYKLDVSKAFLKTSPKKMEKIYNGCGPDWLPEKYRDLLTWAFDRFEEAFLIHDVDFFFSDDSEEGFYKANKRMYANIKKTIKSQLSWWNPNRYWQLLRARGVYKAVDIWGWSAWIDDEEEVISNELALQN